MNAIFIEAQIMKKVVMTQEMIQDYFLRMEPRRFDPNYPFCKICSHIIFVRGKQISANSTIKYFQAEETVYQVTYPNGQKGFYHVKCIDDPERIDQKIMVENILRYDIDKWNGLKDFIENLVEKKVSDKKIRAKIKERFNCSPTSAWRRLREYQGKCKI